MSISALIADGFIIFDPSVDTATRQLFEAELEVLYGTQTGQALYDSLRTDGKFLTIHKTGNGSAAEAGIPGVTDLNIYINPNENLIGIDSTGNEFVYSLARVIAHESIHAIKPGYLDTIDDLTGGDVNPDYAGRTVTETNLIAAELGEPLRVSYAGLTSTTLPPHPLHRLSHDIQRIPRTIVSCDGVGTVPKDRHREGLWAASVPELVLHAVPERVHGDFLVRDN